MEYFTSFSLGKCALHTIMRFGHTELIENSVGLPPPMVFGLGKFSLSIVPVQIWPIGIETFQPLSSKIKGWCRLLALKYHEFLHQSLNSQHKSHKKENATLKNRYRARPRGLVCLFAILFCFLRG